MSRATRANDVMEAFYNSIKRFYTFKCPEDRIQVAAALREAVEGLNIEPNPDRELSIEKHHFIRGQNWVKDAIMRLADEIDWVVEE